ATYEYRLLDIEFYLPGSRVRRHKTAFHQRLRVMIAELADLASVDEAVQRLADVLRCPVALVTAEATARAGADGAMTDIPRPALRQIERTLVTRELPGSGALAHLLQQHRIAAVVPFHPYSRNAGGWLLLGESFAEEVVTPLDFRLVERLFDRLADLFVDRQLALRATLDAALGEIAVLRQEIEAARTQPAARPRVAFAGDSGDFKLLRSALPEVLLHQPGQTPHILITGSAACDPDPATLGCDVMLWGTGLAPRARALATSPRLVDLATPEEISHRVHVVLGLRAALQEDTDPEEPLLGTSPAFLQALRAARALRDSGAVWLRGADRGQAWAWARLISGLPVIPAGAESSAACAWLVEEERALPPGRVFIYHPDPALAQLWNAQPFAVPPLSERGEDVTLLAQYFAVRFRQRTGALVALSEDMCLDILCARPATVAELRAETYARLGASDLEAGGVECGAQNLRAQVENFEADLIRQTLGRCGGNRAQAARLLGLKPNTLHYKLKRYGLT
ncbi:MAG TPA: helix-turn-helix domain-containing protein, partial [Acidiferrobacteraceae bacterium]|nr:helix-turn-helix domain-containing protein [Acidiferrobacteraceae bacterium]